MKCGLMSDFVKSIFILFYTLPVSSIPKSFLECHEDFMLYPKDGVLPPYTFGWMGILQYENVMTKLRSYFKAPRVVLIHKQFVLANSKDVTDLPENYKLGNIAIDDYERLELECGLTGEQLSNGERCPRAVMEVPIAKVLVHPEGTRFQVATLALIKLIMPLSSPYVLPICLPTFSERKRLVTAKEVILVDYMNSVPIHFGAEKKAKKTLVLLSEEECNSLRRKLNTTDKSHESLKQVFCTSGCGARSGSPILSHSPEGPFEIVAIAIGGKMCESRRMRNKVLKDPPVYIDVYPYKTWIINVITAELMPNNIPIVTAANKEFARRRSRKSSYYEDGKQIRGWRGKWYAYGEACFEQYKFFHKKNIMFYYEILQVNSFIGNKVNYLLELSAGPNTTITCVKLKMPFRNNSYPEVVGLGTRKVNVSFETKWFPENFQVVVGMWGEPRKYTRKIYDIVDAENDNNLPSLWARDASPRTLSSDEDESQQSTTTQSVTTPKDSGEVDTELPETYGAKPVTTTKDSAETDPYTLRSRHITRKSISKEEITATPQPKQKYRTSSPSSSIKHPINKGLRDYNWYR